MSFNRIVGQERAIGLLRGVLKSGRIATAYLFSGEKGIGKYLTALEFAKALNCESAVGGDACDDCLSCRKIGDNKHPDIMTLVPENGLISVDAVREVEDFLSLAAYEGMFKVVIMDDADMMNVYAANAFLKTLEEPPAGSVIILVTSRQEMLADTIRSRCLRVRFDTLSIDELRSVAREHGLDDSDETRLRLAMGRVGQLFDEGLIERRDGALDTFLDMVAGRTVTVPKERDEIDVIMDYIFIFLRDIVVFSSTGDSDMLINHDRAGEISALCKDIDLKGIINIYGLFLDLRRQTVYHLNRALVMNYMSSVLSMMGRRRKRQ